MKWERAVHHLEGLATACAEWTGFGALRVTQLWARGEILGPKAELEVVGVALGVDLPPAEVAWWTEPPGSQYWANSVRLNKNPISPWWRSAHAPVWNHRIVRPALIWDVAGGIRADALAAIRAGDGEAVRSAAPGDAELAARLHDELAVSLAELRAASAEYEERRWAPGKLERYADRLYRATDGYLDVLAATSPSTPTLLGRDPS